MESSDLNCLQSILCGQLAIWLYRLLYCGGLPIVSCLLALLGGEKLAVGLYQLLQCGGLPAADCLSLGRGKLSVGDTSCFSAACCPQMAARGGSRVAESWLFGYTSCFSAVGCL